MVAALVALVRGRGASRREGTGMRFDVGWFDRLFGKKLELEVPTTDGRTVRRKVTGKWLDKMEAEGKIRKLASPVVSAHVLDPVRGYYVAQWTVGQDIAEDAVDGFIDPDTNSVYVLSFFQAGRLQMRVVQKELWEQAYDATENV